MESHCLTGIVTREHWLFAFNIGKQVLERCLKLSFLPTYFSWSYEIHMSYLILLLFISKHFFPASDLQWVLKSLCPCVLSCVQLFVTPWNIAHQTPLPRDFSRQEYWSGLPFSPPWNLPDPGIWVRNPHLLSLLHWRVDSLPLRQDCLKALIWINAALLYWYYVLDLSERHLFLTLS